jgi:arylsulfatase
MSRSVCLVAVAAVIASTVLAPTAWAQDKPNVVLMVTDNLGWGEIGVYGGGILRGAPTPRLDELADQGLRLLNFNVEAQCTPSRSALMSGRYPIRSGTTKVVWGMPYGLVAWEETMAELFSGAGYATGMYGKWHLGEIEGRFPTDQGFDEWYGIPNTTDEALYAAQPGFDPEVVEPPVIMESVRGAKPKHVKPYDLDTRKTIDSELNQRAIAFMERHVGKGKPFFAYIPYTQAHLPPTAHPDFEGSTGNGVWADMLAEMDHRAGEILDAVDRLGIRDDTIVVWMSENGPEEGPSYFGTAGYWRGHYFTTLEGSLRAPFIVRWPGRIEAGSVSDEIVHITDLLPTFSGVAGYRVPTDRIIDGVDQLAFFTGKTDTSAREGFPAYNGEQVQAYKWRNFKVRYIEQNSMFDAPIRLNFPRVHDLRRDPKELYGLYGGMGETGTENLTWVLPAVTKRLLAHRKTLAQEPPIKTGTPEPYVPPTR